MTRPVRTQWVPREDVIKPDPPSVRMQKAKRLPMPGPGIMVSVPLHLLDDYLALYRLTPAGIQEPKHPPKDGPGEAVLLVKRKVS